MKSLNLIPAARLLNRRRRLHLKRCVIACAAYGVIVVAGALACRCVWGGSNPALPARLSEASAELEKRTHDLAGTRSELDAVQSTLRASRSIAEQPDWSTLLTLLAMREGDDIVLRDCHVLPMDPSAARQDANDKARESERVRDAARAAGRPAATASPQPATSDLPMVLNIGGSGRSQPAVSQFALRLEATHLFARVTMLDTNREMLFGGEAVAFRIQCSLDEPAGSATALISGGGQR